MYKKKKWIVVFLLFPMIVIFINTETANAQSSENFKITQSVIDQGGIPSLSAQHKIVDAIGQSASIGEAASSNYAVAGGFFGCTVSSASVIVSGNINYLNQLDNGVSDVTIQLDANITTTTKHKRRHLSSR